jgi:pimeloyl-ACP methyl ester carboxylesterase
MEPRHGSVRYLLAGRFASMAWVEWGDPDAPPVICLHGLTRNGRDFDPLAKALAADFRVICPDLPGRGASDWLSDPTLYVPPSYLAPMSHLLAVIGQPVAFLGTSLGGIVGMLIAACAGQPITRLVLNDVGRFIPAAALARISDYMGKKFEFADVAALTQHLRLIHAPFGDLTPAQWAHLGEHSARVLENGRIGLHYDPAIAAPVLAGEPADVDLTAIWRQVTVPVLTLRGETSDLLLPETLAQMAADGSATHVVPGAGHAPALMDAPTIAVVRRFLLGG